jgi:hypothetical protein
MAAGFPRSPAGALPSDLAETEQAVAVARVADAVLVDASDAFCKVVGRTRAELLGHNVAVHGISTQDRLDWLISRFRAAGGDSVIESAIGRGTTVRMRVPILVPELPAVRAEL